MNSQTSVVYYSVLQVLGKVGVVRSVRKCLISVQHLSSKQTFIWSERVVVLVCKGGQYTNAPSHAGFLLCAIGRLICSTRTSCVYTRLLLYF